MDIASSIHYELPQALLSIKYLSGAESVAISHHPGSILEASVMVNLHCQLD